MGYRTTPKAPLIAKSPNNSGFYLDLYTEATRRSGYKLEIIRQPKKRMQFKLEDGTVDFYTVFLLSRSRSEFIFFIETGIYDRNVAMTRRDISEITSFNDLDTLVYLQSLGNVDYLEHIDKTKLKIKKVPESGVARIIKMLDMGHGDVSIYQKSVVIYHLKKNGITTIRLHHQLLPEILNLTLGFSRHLPHFAGVINDSFQSTKPISIDNFPVTLSDTCTAYKLQKALLEMSNDGFTDSLYQYYYGNDQ